ncbi:MAG: hypothetical protein ACE15D_17135 [Candidatus Eisenbacteria bacterium]
MKPCSLAGAALFVLLAVAVPLVAHGLPLVESIEGPDGARLVRSLTPAQEQPALPLPVAGAQGPAARDANDYLWIDTNHQDAIAEDVAITGDGVSVFAGWWLNNKRVALYTFAGDAAPEWTFPMSLAEFQIRVDADDSGDRLTATGRGEPLYVFDEGSNVPLFTEGYGGGSLVGYWCAVSDGGETIAAAAGNPAGGEGAVFVYSGDGQLRFTRSLPAPPEGLALSEDGHVVAANVRTFVKIWDADTGALRDSVAIPGETQVPAVLSADGSVLVTGGFSRTVRVYRWTGAAYEAAWSHAIPSTTWITALDVSEDGSTIAAGTWTSPEGGKVVLYDAGSSTPLWTDSSYGDEVASVAFTPNGQLLAAGSWGRYNATVGNVITVYHRDGSLLYNMQDDAVPGIGSCFDVEISETGTHLVAGGKAVHAREFGRGGFVVAIDLQNPANVEEVSLPGIDHGLSAYPNPFRGAVRFETRRASAGASVSGAVGGGNAADGGEMGAVLGPLAVYGADGRLIRSLAADPVDGGWIWDGRDERGREVPPGVYFAVRSGSRGATGEGLRILRIR